MFLEEKFYLVLGSSSKIGYSEKSLSITLYREKYEVYFKLNKSVLKAIAVPIVFIGFINFNIGSEFR